MRGNWIEMSASAAAANANPMTLSAVTNLPTFADVFGTSGSRIVEYELDDGAGHYECGYGNLTLSTLSLSRDYPISTYDSGATPKYVSNNATRLTTFGAAVTIRCAPIASAMSGGENFHVASAGIGNAYSTNQNDVTYQGTIQGWRNFIPFKWTGTRPIVSAAIYVNTAATAGTLRLGVMEITGPTTYNLIQEFTATSQFNLAVTGKQLINDFPKLYLPQGIYVLQYVPVGVTGAPKLYMSQNNVSNACGVFGRTANGQVYNGFLDSAGATTLATSFSTNPNGGYIASNLQDFVFGMS